MKILWLINIPLPEASLLMKQNITPYGGWLIKASQALVNKKGIELAITFPQKNNSEYKKVKGQSITYYTFTPVKGANKKSIENDELIKIIKEVNPDIVHIYGTEMPHTLAMINILNKNKIKTVISIQGLVSVIPKHFEANLPLKTIYGFTLRNILLKDNVGGLKKQFIKSGINEIEAIRKAKNIIGRTTWDRACTSQINPNSQYFFCNETLREEFYKHIWDIEKCEEHSIFLSQGQYPIKGLHYVIEAMPLILKRFPNTKLYISGKDITRTETIKDKLFITYYGKYIKKMIRNYGLEPNVVFIGPLNEKQMCERYLKSNVFVCPSSIENSPNSLGEAMILGIPSIASDVGGISDMMRHKEEGFVYQHDAFYMLAYYVCEIFKDKELALKFSENGRKRARETHDPVTNTNQLLEIYRSIMLKKE